MIDAIREALLRERDRILDRMADERALSPVNDQMVATLERDLNNIQKSLHDTSGVSDFLAARRAR